MVVFNYSGREINAKIVYYGPGLSGKTTNLERIYGQVPEQRRGKMVSMKTRSDRTLFFDFLPVSGGEIKGFRTRYLLYTVPGQVHYNATRKLVLKGTDAIIFVADSDPVLRDANIESMANLEENLAEYGLSTDKIPIIIQYNKRDVPNPMSIEQLNADINPRGWPWFEGVAIEDKGVWETFRAAVDALFKTLEENLGGDDSSSKKAAASQEDQAEPALVAPPETEGGITLSGDVTHGDGADSGGGDSTYNVDESIKGDAPVKLSDPGEVTQSAPGHQQEAASAEQPSPSRGTQNGQNIDWRENYIPPGAKQRTQASTATQSPAATQEPAPHTEPEPQEAVATGSPEVGHVDQAGHVPEPQPAATAAATVSATDGVVQVPIKVETEHGVLRLEISINLQLKEGATPAVVDSGGDWK